MKQLFTFIIFILIALLPSYLKVFAQSPKEKKWKPVMPKPIKLEEQLSHFNKDFDTASYLVSLCADMPYDKDPLRVAYNQEPGHVFLIMQKVNEALPGDTINLVFGFYPTRGLPLIFKRRMNSRIKDNSMRLYDVRITKQVSAAAFKALQEEALAMSKKDYHLNRYNCYDYAVALFNSLLTKDTIPLQRTKFPFPFGHGGSPVCLYTFLQANNFQGEPFNYVVNMGGLIAPRSAGRTKK